MEAVFINSDLHTGRSLQEAMAILFTSNTAESATVTLWKVFQCWAKKDCFLESDISNKELALFLDQLIDLVAAAYIEHQANRVSVNAREGREDA